MAASFEESTNEVTVHTATYVIRVLSVSTLNWKQYIGILETEEYLKLMPQSVGSEASVSTDLLPLRTLVTARLTVQNKKALESQIGIQSLNSVSRL